MLVFFKARLVMLSVPKTGTTAYEAALGRHADIVISGPPGLKHMPLYRYNTFLRPMIDKVVGKRLEILAVVREPVDWLGSWYRYRQRPGMEGHPNATLGLTFDEFVAAYLQPERPAYANVGSQAKFVETRANGVRVSHLFRYDSQDAIRAFLSERLGISLEIERRNPSPALPTALSEVLGARLRAECAGEFQTYESAL